ncbi:MAG: DUF3488 and transglutaminase-like domain-containing protein [Thermoanaerobaculum sp.]|nr:DUF3488 and transglutaminase-like domain-containing protein [Thermoanaerobaculum sp.]
MSTSLLWQRWLALAALAVTLPLGFSGAVNWLFLLPLAGVGLALLFSRTVYPPLPAWVENLLAPLILLAALAAGGLRFGILRPVANLLVLLTAVRLWGGAPRPRRYTVLALLAVLNAAGVASSTHPALVLYLAVGLAALTFATAQLLPLELGQRLGGAAPRGQPPWRLWLATTALALAVGAPLFVLFPRLRSPFAAAGMGARPISGFREAVSLHQLGEIKTSRRPMLRVRFPDQAEVNPQWLRFVGATLSHYRAGRWLEGRRQVQRGDLPILRGDQVGVRAEFSLEQTSDRLFLPPGARRLVPPEVEVWLDGAEAVRIPRGLVPPIAYQVVFDPSGVYTRPPGDEDLAVPISRPALERLAQRVTEGHQGAWAKAKALETYLQANYRYSTRTLAPLRADPVEWFLWTSREGHCEFFASAMVLLLRAQGIPARLQTGFAGGQDLGNGEFLLRDANAHAWVLAFVNNRWHIFDPTPPEGQPAAELGRSAWDWRAIWARLGEIWDRWIITFSLADQLDVLLAVWAKVRRHWLWIAVAGLVALAGVAVAVLSRRWRPRPQARLTLSPLGRSLWQLARLAGWEEGALHHATPTKVLETLLLRLERSRATCQWLFLVHQQVTYGLVQPPGARQLRRALREVRGELVAYRRQGSTPPPGEG